MSMTPAEVERKVRQLDNDVQSIYELLATINGTLGRHSNRFDELGQDVARLDAKVDGLDAKVTGLDAKVDGLDTKVDGLDTKVDGLDTKMDTVLELLRAR
jgi:outer membrane murein-binding lipoprotein Lpp